ncbi:pyruvate dehydrogenase X component [Wolfiporia cocos MD-104 SS10]|uniref:Pyruvate dehydrogenase X component n=1 Tax=Wolfiporia cocos (strain MD-104) TaxID=742152 RepID=A0A2H3J825_WOLCO|nr:pyruvate dehydrogenase X component [Wolfiporia cocos MD-104 SS10]
MQAASQLSKAAARSLPSRRWMQTTAARLAVTKFTMPAMSPTMTEGGIADWKKKDGEAFSAGDVLLEIETDKATIDVEAQDDGVMGKILVPNGAKNIRVGQLIALLAEEGDDISNLEAPADESAPTPNSESASAAPLQSQPPSSVPDKQQSAPSVPPTRPTLHPESSRPLFPSVLRLLQENSISDADKIKGTGVRGMLTKGDVLAYLGKASGPLGTFKEAPKEDATKPPKKEEPQILDGPALRRLIVGNMLDASIKARAAAVSTPPADFDSIIADYLPPTKAAAAPPAPKPTAGSQYLDGLV